MLLPLLPGNVEHDVAVEQCWKVSLVMLLPLLPIVVVLDVAVEHRWSESVAFRVGLFEKRENNFKGKQLLLIEETINKQYFLFIDVMYM
jgi:hypothetical protein